MGADAPHETQHRRTSTNPPKRPASLTPPCRQGYPIAEGGRHVLPAQPPHDSFAASCGSLMAGGTPVGSPPPAWGLKSPWGPGHRPSMAGSATPGLLEGTSNQDG